MGFMSSIVRVREFAKQWRLHIKDPDDVPIEKIYAIRDPSAPNVELKVSDLEALTSEMDFRIFLTAVIVYFVAERESILPPQDLIPGPKMERLAEEVTKYLNALGEHHGSLYTACESVLSTAEPTKPDKN